MQNAECRNPKSVLDGRASASPASRSARHAPGAFTLIELLVVIGVIVILAGLSFPAMQAVQRAQAIHRAQAELNQIQTAIQTYKTKLGFYPPDNTNNWYVNQLYYELMGTTYQGQHRSIKPWMAAPASPSVGSPPRFGPGRRSPVS